MRCYLVILAVTLATSSPGHSAADPEPEPRPLAVVVARGSKVTSLSRQDLRRVFSGTVVSAGGGRVVPFNFPPSSPERVAFDRAVLDMSPEDAGRYWVDRKVRGQSAAPRALPSALHVGKVVARLPGALGYLPADQVGANLQVVAIDGRRPGQPGYALAGD